MAVKAGKVEVKRSRGQMVVNALAQTPRGTTFINASKVLKAKSTIDKGFRKELAEAIEEFFGTAS